VIGSSVTHVDRAFLERAVALARKGWGRVHPNPLVGCVLVKNGTIVGEGYHQEFGEDHAETLALHAAGGQARGSTAYVSLEPCAHFGKTPPCAHALHEAGVSRVVYGGPDLGAEEGGGGAWLRAQGVEVEGPVLSPERWRGENPVFYHSIEDRPFVALKMAVGLDGGISAALGLQTTITGPEAQEEVHRLRAGYGGVLVGTRTWKTDDPRLNPRGPLQPRILPVRVFLDPRGEFPEGARALLNGDGGTDVMGFPPSGGEVVLAVGSGLASTVSTRFGNQVSVIGVAEGPDGLDLASLLTRLSGKGLTSLLCEGGGRLASSLLKAGLVDRLYWFSSPKILGPHAIPALAGLEREDLGDWRVVVAPQLFGADVLTTYDRVR